MLNKLKPTKSKTNRRIGRGYGSTKGGHTVGRGQKGQKSRAGYKSPRPGFEGGAMPLSRRLPKLKGFNKNTQKGEHNVVEINVTKLNKFENGSTVNTTTLRESGLLKSKSKSNLVKILGNGDLTKKLTVEGLVVTKQAKSKIEKAGGEVK